MSSGNSSAPTSSQGPPPATVSNAQPATSSSLESLQAVAAVQGSNTQLNGLSPEQLITILRTLPVFNSKQTDQGKEAAAEVLSNLSQSAGPSPSNPFQTSPTPNSNIHPQLQGHEPGPNSHPHGPPTLGMTQIGPPLPPSQEPVPLSTGGPNAELKAGRRRTGPPTVNGAAVGSEEWSRQRKDNHKEVERRRRGNINEGINELARIVPNGTGEKAKGAILSRSVQYIHHLKENEARNIEKWTLEKLLMDQAMGDLQAQLEEVKRMWEDERRKREKAEAELSHMRSEISAVASGKKRSSAEAEDLPENSKEGEDRGAKRTRVSA